MAEIEESSETENLEEAYIAEDPSSLTDEDFQKVADHYGLSIEKVKSIAKSMTKNRSRVDPSENL